MSVILDDIGAWVAIGVGLTVIIGGLYGLTRWARKQLKDVILDDIKPALDHLHDCIEKVGTEATEFASMAADEATQARVASSEAHTAVMEAQLGVDRTAADIKVHADKDERSFDEITAWRSQVDVANAEASEERARMLMMLQNIQSGQAPHVPEK